MKHTFIIALLLLFCIQKNCAQTDSIPPRIDTAFVTSPNTIELHFSEALDTSIAKLVSCYMINVNVGLPLYVLISGGNRNVTLYYHESLPVRVNLLLTVTGIRDIAGNVMWSDTLQLLIYKPMPFDIVIDEIMADPSPVVGLPETEWIEIRNVSPFTINLMGWRLCKAIGRSGPMPDWKIAPDSVVIVCSSGSVAAMRAFGSSFSVTSFPSLINTGDLLYLTSPEGSVIHTVKYSDEWYQNDLKKLGGWSLEMIDINNPCEGSENWLASRGVLGGTPGVINSVDAVNIDEDPPRLLRATVTDSTGILIWFNESLDSGSAANNNKYTISNGIQHPVSTTVLPPLYDKVLLKIAVPLDTTSIYQIIVNDVRDCLQNEVGAYRTAFVGVPARGITNELVINEVLFNPPDNGVDFVELMNRSKKVIDLKNVYIAHRDVVGSITDIQSLSPDSYLCFPGDYVVITEDAFVTRTQHSIPEGAILLQTDAMPSFNDDEGDVVLMNQNGEVVDELKYQSNWHFQLLENVEGVSLERINPNTTTQNPSNWHSASATVGYASPGSRNSQYFQNEQTAGNISISPKMISPDNDGKDDFLNIHYQFAAPGTVASMIVFAQNGKVVRHLKQSYLCGTTGDIVWDGLDDGGRRVPSSLYILFTETFNAQGKKGTYKNPFIVK